jgi:CxxC-x17-CxxC domain-containing protein
MGNFNRGGNRGGGGGRFFGRDGFGRKNFDRGDSRGGRGDRQMFKATCSNCGKDCEVPFRPTNSKPVYCSDCFEKMGGPGRDDRQSSRPRFNDRPRFDEGRPQGPTSDQNKALLESINNKLDRILQVLVPQKPETKPVEKSVEPLVTELQNIVDEEIKVNEATKVKSTPKVKKTPNKEKK